MLLLIQPGTGVSGDQYKTFSEGDLSVCVYGGGWGVYTSVCSPMAMCTGTYFYMIPCRTSTSSKD